jgi:hypothetical protein
LAYLEDRTDNDKGCACKGETLADRAPGYRVPNLAEDAAGIEEPNRKPHKGAPAVPVAKGRAAQHRDPNSGEAEPKLKVPKDVNRLGVPRPNANPTAVPADSPFNTVRDGAEAAKLHRSWEATLAAWTEGVSTDLEGEDLGGGIKVSVHPAERSPAYAGCRSLSKYDAGKSGRGGTGYCVQGNGGAPKGGGKR